MIAIFKCRRSSLALIGMIILGVSMWSGQDTSSAIAMICIGVAAANSHEKKIGNVTIQQPVEIPEEKKKMGLTSK